MLSCCSMRLFKWGFFRPFIHSKQASIVMTNCCDTVYGTQFFHPKLNLISARGCCCSCYVHAHVRNVYVCSLNMSYDKIVCSFICVRFPVHMRRLHVELQFIYMLAELHQIIFPLFLLFGRLIDFFLSVIFIFTYFSCSCSAYEPTKAA